MLRLFVKFGAESALHPTASVIMLLPYGRWVDYAGILIFAAVRLPCRKARIGKIQFSSTILFLKFCDSRWTFFVYNSEEAFDEYVYYYNYDRPAAALGYKSPVQYKTELGF